jgi:hypothetical protein
MYRTKIEALTSHDPRHVEAWMRLEHGTLDHLDAARFESEVCIANACITEAGVSESESLALSYGL